MDNPINDKNSAEYQWAKYLANQRVEDFMYLSTDHGPEWSEKEIKEAVDAFCKNLTRIKRREVAEGRVKEHLKDFKPKKTKKKLIEYIKKNISYN